MYIDENGLDAIAKFLEKDIELCGFLITAPNDPVANIVVKGTGSPTGRLSCTLPRYDPYIWHTHPAVAKGYPSVEDISISLRKPIHTQIIFTSWGVWEISAQTKLQKLDAAIRKEIEQAGHALYTVSERGRVYKSSLNPLIRSFLNQLEYIFDEQGLRVHFRAWENIGSKYILKTIANSR
jgi:hypothetical protein